MQSERGEDVGSQCSLICQQVVLMRLRDELRSSVREEREISLLLFTFFSPQSLSFEEAHERE